MVFEIPVTKPVDYPGTQNHRSNLSRRWIPGKEGFAIVRAFGCTTLGSSIPAALNFYLANRGQSVQTTIIIHANRTCPVGLSNEAICLRGDVFEKRVENTTSPNPPSRQILLFRPATAAARLFFLDSRFATSHLARQWCFVFSRSRVVTVERFSPARDFRKKLRSGSKKGHIH